MTLAPPAVDISTLLYMKPSPAGGRLCLSGSGVSVKAVIGWFNQGWTPEEIRDDYGQITLPAVYAAITYYLANKERMDAELEEEERVFDELKAYYEKHESLPDRYK